MMPFFFCLICMAWMAPVAMADIYQCMSSEGVVTFSDYPCDNNAVLFSEARPDSVDDVLKQEIAPFLTPHTIESYNTYIAGEAERIGRRIFPNLWCSSAEVIKVYAQALRSGTFQTSDPVYGTTPGWVVFLHFGPLENRLLYKLDFRFDSLVKKDLDGVLKSVVTLRSIAILKDKMPFTPENMKTITRLKQIGAGEWEAR